ncbi:hypothetical protein [Sphingomonas prati]|uniref:DNA-binding FadR family transcriptional regulator n=1 Tax=Sphingomonas prati TaxID=1843237 RepID=A0A7W9F1W2_9SPHN|nr:hypothetical protein [Sphingomonas prati]MBB5729676.1 DNA-binding FadR family transcriptional regulator [Sphingomonas prati]
MIALAVQGCIDVRVGAGAFVRRVRGEEGRPGIGITTLELTEARLVFEGEAAAPAAITITDQELAELKLLVEAIGRE